MPAGVKWMNARHDAPLHADRRDTVTDDKLIIFDTTLRDGEQAPAFP